MEDQTHCARWKQGGSIQVDTHSMSLYIKQGESQACDETLPMDDGSSQQLHQRDLSDRNWGRCHVPFYNCCCCCSCCSSQSDDPISRRGQRCRPANLRGRGATQDKKNGPPFEMASLSLLSLTLCVYMFVYTVYVCRGARKARQAKGCWPFVGSAPVGPARDSCSSSLDCMELILAKAEQAPLVARRISGPD